MLARGSFTTMPAWIENAAGVNDPADVGDLRTNPAAQHELKQQMAEVARARLLTTDVPRQFTSLEVRSAAPCRAHGHAGDHCGVGYR